MILDLANDEIRGARLDALTVKPWGHGGERMLCLQFFDPVYVRSVEARIQELVRHGNQSSGFGKTSSALVLNCVGPAPRPPEQDAQEAGMAISTYERSDSRNGKGCWPPAG